MERRKFLHRLAALGAALTVTRFPGLMTHAWADQTQGRIPYRPLGSTGEQVSIVGLGGFHLGRPDEPESIRIVRTAIDHGVRACSKEIGKTHPNPAHLRLN